MSMDEYGRFLQRWNYLDDGMGVFQIGRHLIAPGWSMMVYDIPSSKGGRNA